MTRQVLESARMKGGAEAVARLLEAVSPACRARFSHPIGFFEWVESDLAVELHETWSALQGEDTMAIRGEDAARRMLQGPQGWLLRIASPTFLLDNLPRLFAFYYRGGFVQVESLAPNRSRVTLCAQGYPLTWHAEALPSWLAVALDLTGGKQVHVAHRSSGSRHFYDASWT